MKCEKKPELVCSRCQELQAEVVRLRGKLDLKNETITTLTELLSELRKEHPHSTHTQINL